MSENHKKRLQKIKTKFPKAYEPWSKAEEELLKTSYADGMSIDRLAKYLSTYEHLFLNRDTFESCVYGNPLGNDNRIEFLQRSYQKANKRSTIQ